MVHFIELVLVLAILIIVGIPLFTQVSIKTLFSACDPELERYKHLLVRKEEILLSIKELEFDNKTGKLSPEDFESTKKKLEAEALDVLGEIDRLEKEHAKTSFKNSKKLEMV